MYAGCAGKTKLWDPLRTRALPERLRGVLTTRRYTNSRLPLPLPVLRIEWSRCVATVTVGWRAIFSGAMVFLRPFHLRLGLYPEGRTLRGNYVSFEWRPSLCNHNTSGWLVIPPTAIISIVLPSPKAWEQRPEDEDGNGGGELSSALPRLRVVSIKATYKS